MYKILAVHKSRNKNLDVPIQVYEQNCVKFMENLKRFLFTKMRKQLFLIQ